MANKHREAKSTVAKTEDAAQLELSSTEQSTNLHLGQWLTEATA